MYSKFGNSSIEFYKNHYGDSVVPLDDIEMHNSIYLAQNGDLYSRNKIIESVLCYIEKRANELARPGFEKDDLIQIGVLGCIKAIDTFNLALNFKFITYADTCISNEIRSYMRNNTRYQNSLRLNSTFEFKCGNNVELIELIEDPNSCKFIEELEDASVYNSIRILIESLPERERLLLEYYYGLNNKPQKSQLELENIFGLSQSYISRLISKTLITINEILKK